MIVYISKFKIYKIGWERSEWFLKSMTKRKMGNIFRNI